MDTENNNSILLSEAIKQMEFSIKQWDLSDEYLKEHFKCVDNSFNLRKGSFAGEWSYGITMVPCSFAIQLAKKVLEKEGDQFIPFE